MSDANAPINHVAVLGGGAWGTALAMVCRRAGRPVTLWVRNAALATAVLAERENRRYLPGIALDSAIDVSSDLGAATVSADAVLVVTPAQAVGPLAEALYPLIRPGVPVILCAKGIENGSLHLMTDVVGAVLPAAALAVLSGPTFAAEVARALPTAVTLATADVDTGARLTTALGSRTFRPYLTDDLVGVQVGGAVKNVLAIACGIIMGLGLGDNARAALITRGLAEMTRLGVALGGRATTFMGLSGLGDLSLTCASLQSRNMSLGYALGQGRSLSAILEERRTVTEGVHSAAAVAALAARHGIDMPICSAIDDVLNQGRTLADTIAQLLSRPFRDEGW